jgi:hypothetical protein
VPFLYTLKNKKTSAGDNYFPTEVDGFFFLIVLCSAPDQFPSPPQTLLALSLV